MIRAIALLLLLWSTAAPALTVAVPTHRHEDPNQALAVLGGC